MVELADVPILEGEGWEVRLRVLEAGGCEAELRYPRHGEILRARGETNAHALFALMDDFRLSAKHPEVAEAITKMAL